MSMTNTGTAQTERGAVPQFHRQDHSGADITKETRPRCAIHCQGLNCRFAGQGAHQGNSSVSFTLRNPDGTKQGALNCGETSGRQHRRRSLRVVSLLKFKPRVPFLTSLPIVFRRWAATRINASKDNKKVILLNEGMR
jgi:hypothetical protein